MKLNDDMKELQQNKGLKMIVNFLVSAPNHLASADSVPVWMQFCNERYFLGKEIGSTENELQEE